MHAGGERGHKKRKRLLGSGERPIGKRFSSSSVHFAERNEEEEEHKTHVFSLSLPLLLSVAAVMKREDGRRRGEKCDSPFPPFFFLFQFFPEFLLSNSSSSSFRSLAFVGLHIPVHERASGLYVCPPPPTPENKRDRV